MLGGEGLGWQARHLVVRFRYDSRGEDVRFWDSALRVGFERDAEVVSWRDFVTHGLRVMG